MYNTGADSGGGKNMAGKPLLGGPKCTCLHLDLLKVNSHSFDHCINLSISPCSFISSFVLFSAAYNKKGQPKTRNDKKKLYIHGQEYAYHTL
jgi:hypothetical protein